MAEAIVLVGVVAAAAQFIEVGCKVILHTSSLFSRFRDVPRCLQQVQDQVQLLLHLAELTSRKNMMQPLSDNSPQPIQLGTPRFPLSWLESVWTKCAQQAHDLDGLIRPMLQVSGNARSQRVWKECLMLGREEKMNQILKEMESYKTMLTLWFGQECLDQIYQLKQDVISMHGDMENLGKSTVQPHQTCPSLIHPQTPSFPESTSKGSHNEHRRSIECHGQQTSCTIEDRRVEYPEVRQELCHLVSSIAKGQARLLLTPKRQRRFKRQDQISEDYGKVQPRHAQLKHRPIRSFVDQTT